MSLFVIVLFNSLWSTARTFTRGQKIEKYREVANFLKEKSGKNEIIFHDRWDSFFPLWYYNQNNRYISGFDPTFLFKKDPELFWKYERIASGAIQKGAAAQIGSLFNARLILVEKENKPLQAALTKDTSVKMVYEDEYVAVFLTAPPSPK